MRKLTLLFLIFQSLASFAQHTITRKLKSQDVSNYVLQQVLFMQQLFHDRVLKQEIPAYQSAAFTNTYTREQLQTRGGYYETVQYTPDPKDHYFYKDTSLLTEFNPDRFTAMGFIGKNGPAPSFVSDIKGIAFYYAPNDTSKDVIYYLRYSDIQKLLTEEQAALIELGLKQVSNNKDKLLTEEDWIVIGASLFNDMKQQVYSKAVSNASICYSDQAYTHNMTAPELAELENFNYLKSTGEDSTPVSKRFESNDIDFIIATVNVSTSDSATLLKPVAFCPGHYLVITGVDNLERQLFWVKQQDLFPLVNSTTRMFLKQSLYYNYLNQLDGNKTYTSDYLLRKERQANGSPDH
jgi:glutaredoxin 2